MNLPRHTVNPVLKHSVAFEALTGLGFSDLRAQEI